MNDSVVCDSYKVSLSDRKKGKNNRTKRHRPFVMTEAKQEALRKARLARKKNYIDRQTLTEAQLEEKRQALLMPKLTERQRKFVINVSKGMPRVEAALQAGYSPNGIETAVSTTIKKPDVQESLHNLMEAAGLGTDKLLAVHNEMLQATKPISVVTGKDANGSTMDFIDVPDWSARSQALNMGYKLKGLYADQGLSVTVETHEQRMHRLLGMPIDVTPGANSDD